jgi:hypothetical protein
VKSLRTCDARYREGSERKAGHQTVDNYGQNRARFRLREIDLEILKLKQRVTVVTGWLQR